MNTYYMGHDDILKWEHDGHQYCLHVQQDDTPLNPIEDDDLVEIAIWGQNNHLGTVSTVRDEPEKYWQNKVMEYIDGQTVIDMAMHGRLKYVTVKPLGNNEFERTTKAYGGTLTNTLTADELKDDIVEDMTVPECITALSDVLIEVPLYMYEHSGISISCSNTYPYNDQWDGGQCGWCVITKKTVLDNWGDVPDWKQKGVEVILSTVDTYDKYLQNDVWWYRLLEKNADGDWEELDACGGFLGSEITESGMTDNVGHGLDKAIADETAVKSQAKRNITVTYDYN